MNKENNGNSKKRESYIEKHAELLINLGNWENLRVGTTFGETIEWETAEERQKKLDAITENLKREIAKDVNDYLKSFSLEKRSSTKIENRAKVPFKDEDVKEEPPKKNVDDIEIKIDKDEEDTEINL